ncbi:MAG: hypothetical protein K1000chlam2_00482 [Chlamydiae bacterium]|nr:hypothetical protein [Chlamydiota bacterium]
MKHFNFLIRLSVVVSALIFTSRFCQKKTDTFTILAISSTRPHNTLYETQIEESAELDTALSQPYTYFGRGGQAYAFFSADGKYVVKFFKQRLFRPSWLLNHLPLPKILHRYRFKRNWKRSDKFARDFFSYKVASEELRDETGILYSHLNPTTHLSKTLLITDRLGIVHPIDLDHFDFVVQKRAEMVYDRIDSLMEMGNQKAAKEALLQVFSLISTRAKKGYRDRDPNIRTNCGFIEDKAVKIDVGRFVKNEEMKTPERHNEELLRITAPFEEWIEIHHPYLLPAFHQYLQETLL